MYIAVSRLCGNGRISLIMYFKLHTSGFDCLVKFDLNLKQLPLLMDIDFYRDVPQNNGRLDVEHGVLAHIGARHKICAGSMDNTSCFTQF